MVCCVAILLVVTWAIVDPGIFGYPYTIGEYVFGISLTGLFFGAIFLTLGLAGLVVVLKGYVPTSNLAVSKNPGVIATVSSIIVSAVLATLAYYAGNGFGCAIFVGALGGLVYEMVQSNGQYFLPAMQGGSLYLGGLFGLIGGAVAGVLVAQGLQTAGDPVSVTLLTESFLAGATFKGVSEAAAGQVGPSSPSAPSG